MGKRILKLFFVISIFFVSLNDVLAVEEGASCAEWKNSSSESTCQTTYSYGEFAKVETTPGGFYQLRIPFTIVVSCDHYVGRQAVYDQYMTGAGTPYSSSYNFGDYGSAGSNSKPIFKDLHLTDDTDDVVIKMTEDNIENLSHTTTTSSSAHPGSPWNSLSSVPIPDTDDIKDVIYPDVEEQPENPPKVYTVPNPYSPGGVDHYYQLPGEEGGYKLEYEEKPDSRSFTDYIGDSYSYSSSCPGYTRPSEPCKTSLTENSDYGDGYVTGISIDDSVSCVPRKESTYYIPDTSCNQNNDNSSDDTASGDSSNEKEGNDSDNDSSEGKTCPPTECTVTKTRCNCYMSYTLNTIRRIYYIKMYYTVTDTWTGEYVLPLSIPPESSERFEGVNGKFIPLSTLTGDYKYIISFNEDGSEEIGKCDLKVTGDDPDPPIPDIPWNKLIGFRQVDLSNMFPGRNPKKNWQGYDIGIDIVRSTNSPMYVINLTPEIMKNIAKTNSLGAYINWGEELNDESYHPMKIIDGIKSYDYNSDYKSNFVTNLADQGVIRRFEDNIIARNKFLVANGYNEYYTNLDYLETEDGDEE